MTDHADSPEMAPQWDIIAAAVAGTTMSVPEIADRWDANEDDVEVQLGEQGVETCVVCGWWFFDYGTEGDPMCEDCESDDTEASSTDETP